MPWKCLKPSAIFVKIPPEMFVKPERKSIPFGEDLEGQKGSAIKWYFDKHPIPIIPIDLSKRNKIYTKSVTADGYREAFKFLQSLLGSSKLVSSESQALEAYFETVNKQRILALNGTGYS